MSTTTPNLSLVKWGNTDQFSPTDLAGNWDKIDADYTRARPANQAEVLAAVPVSSNFDGRLVYLTAADSGFPAKTLIVYNGTIWRAVGPAEVLSSVPSSGNFAGRMVLLSATSSGFPAWTLIRYDGSAWAQANKGADISATVPVSNNYAGRLVVLSAAASGFAAWDLIRYDGSSWAKIGPWPIPPATEVAYLTQATDLTTTNTVDPGDTINTFAAATMENVKYYFHVNALLTNSGAAGQTVFFRLREATSNITAIIQGPASVGAAVPYEINRIVPFTPTAGSHTYFVTWWVGANTGKIIATGYAPATFRIFKA